MASSSLIFSKGSVDCVYHLSDAAGSAPIPVKGVFGVHPALIPQYVDSVNSVGDYPSV